MNEDEAIKVTGDVPDNTSPRPSPYDLLVRQSKKLGKVATKTLQGARNVLTREINLPSAEQFIGNFPRAPQAKKEHELEKADELRKVVRRSNEVLGRANTVFPVTLFPDTIIVDRTKISIIKRDFFWTSNTISFQVDDVLNVSCAVGPLFGSLTIASRVMSTVDHFTINYLWRNDAMFFKHLIQGHVIARQNKLETDGLNREEMIATLCDIGREAEA